MHPYLYYVQNQLVLTSKMGAIAQCLHTFSVLQDDLHRAMLNEIHAVTFPPFNIQIITQ